MSKVVESKATCRTAMMAVTIFAAFYPFRAFALEPDRILRHEIVGIWTGASDDPLVAGGAKLGIFVSERFNADGTGSMSAYRGKMCGELIRTITFHWEISKGILSTKDARKIDHDKILELAGPSLVFSSLNHAGLIGHRIRFSGCRSV